MRVKRQLPPPLATFAGGLLLGASVAAIALLRGTEADAVPLRRQTAVEPLVTGIGGVFFKARDPDALRAWYRDHLGLEAGPQGTTFLWRHEDDPGTLGRTVWSVFPEDSDYFGPSGQRFMLNYRVADLDRALTALAAAGVTPVKEPEEYPYGRFAWVEDAEGNRIELWEPPS